VTRNPRRRTSHALASVAALTLLAALAACSTRAEPDEIVLYYKSGAGDNRDFKECIQPGEAGSYPVDDVIYPLPTSLRTWNIRPEGGDSDAWIKSSTKPDASGTPGPDVGIYAKVEFYLNTDCGITDDKPEGTASSPIVQFWERTGRRYKVATDGEFSEAGWVTMLKNTLIPAEEAALRGVTRDYSADALDADLGGTWDKVEAAAAQLLLTSLNESVGGNNYFCGPAYARGAEVTWTESKLDANGAVVTEEKKGTCPPVKIEITDINFADPKIAEARAAVFAAEQKAKADLIAAQAKVKEAALLAEANKTPGYLELEKAKLQLAAAQACASNPNCTLIVGSSTGVNITPK
jgi:hypothetical protein